MASDVNPHTEIESLIPQDRAFSPRSLATWPYGRMRRRHTDAATIPAIDAGRIPIGTLLRSDLLHWSPVGDTRRQRVMETRGTSTWLTARTEDGHAWQLLDPALTGPGRVLASTDRITSLASVGEWIDLVASFGGWGRVVALSLPPLTAGEGIEVEGLCWTPDHLNTNAWTATGIRDGGTR